MKVFPREEGVYKESPLFSEVFQLARSIGLRINPKLRYPVEFPPGYLGLQTTEELLPGEELISIPIENVITLKLTNTPELQEIYESNPEVFSLPSLAHENNRLIVFLIRELSKGPKSFWHAFLESEPRDIDVIDDWSEEELKELQNSDIEYDALIRKTHNYEKNLLLANAIQRYPELLKEEFCTIENVIWLWKVIKTRTFQKYANHVPYSLFIPVANLFNHNISNSNYYYWPQDQPPIDWNDEAPDSDYNDRDYLWKEKTHSLNLGFMKLWHLSIGNLDNLNESQTNIKNDLFLHAKTEDTKSFIQSTL